jgi:hypothetical protein
MIGFKLKRLGVLIPGYTEVIPVKPDHTITSGLRLRSSRRFGN